MTYAITPPPVSSLPIAGSDQRFPVRRIFCIGRNYAEHAREMGAVVEKDAPLFFCKPADAVVSDGADVPYPQATADLHHEVEMVVALGAGGRDLSPEAAAALVWGYGVGLTSPAATCRPWPRPKAIRGTWPRRSIIPRRCRRWCRQRTPRWMRVRCCAWK